MKIVFTGGGTAGHIFPFLAIVREIKKNYPDLNFKPYYIGPNLNEHISGLLEKEEIRIIKILTGKLRRYFSLENFLDIFKLPIGLIQSFFWLFFLGPDLVFSKSGYGSFPVAFWANIFGIPFFLHESDSVFGLASKIESKWAQEVFLSFPLIDSLDKNKGIVVGNPVRQEILEGSKKEAQKLFKLQGNKPLILILGGSQGAQKINEVILEILPAFLKDFEIIHQTGRKNFLEVKKEAEAILTDEDLKKDYHPFPFLEEEFYKQALVVADLIISRAGAGAIFEISAAGKPALLIPLAQSAQNHQLKNAYIFTEKGGGEVIEESNFSPHFFLTKLKHLFSRQDILTKMKENSKNFSRSNAAKIIASYLIEYFTQLSNKNRVS